MSLHPSSLSIVLVHGEWGDWTPFSNCSKPCGFGKRVRTRSCDSPKAEYGGKECDADGRIEELEGCNPYPCPRMYLHSF